MIGTELLNCFAICVAHTAAGFIPLVISCIRHTEWITPGFQKKKEKKKKRYRKCSACRGGKVLQWFEEIT